MDAAAGRSYCKVRAFWNAELQTGLALIGANKAHNLTGFDSAVRHGVAGFNFMYADDAGHIAYWHTGRVPVRAPGHDPRLPAPGDGSFDWRGFLAPAQWPSVVDPAQGYLASWNNKPQQSWLDSGDGSLWGAYQRVRQPMALLNQPGRLSQAGIWHVARRTGELDLRATLGFKPFLTALAKRRDLSATERAAVHLVATWDGTAFYPGGAERDSAGTPTGSVASLAFPIFSAWFHSLENRLANPVFGPITDTAGAAGVRAFTQTPQTTSPEFEFFDDYDAFLYNALSGYARQAPYHGHSTISEVSRAALDEAIRTLTSAHGPDMNAWRAAMPQISFQALDVASIGTIPWENRGTWGQAIAFGH
jgi:penicillin amidase